MKSFGQQTDYSDSKNFCSVEFEEIFKQFAFEKNVVIISGNEFLLRSAASDKSETEMKLWFQQKVKSEMLNIYERFRCESWG